MSESLVVKLHIMFSEGDFNLTGLIFEISIMFCFHFDLRELQNTFQLRRSHRMTEVFGSLFTIHIPKGLQRCVCVCASACACDWAYNVL